MMRPTTTPIITAADDSSFSPFPSSESAGYDAWTSGAGDGAGARENYYFFTILLSLHRTLSGRIGVIFPVRIQ